VNRILIPLALVVLVAGCAMPNLFGQQASQPVMEDSARTVVVREVYHETPVYYTDTVYMASDPAPVQPVYVEEEYNQYNEYNETYVYVHEHEVRPSYPRHDERGLQREREQQPRDRRGYGGSPRDRNQPRDEDKPKPINPRSPVKKMNAPVANEHEKSPVPPTQPTPPQRQAPSGSVQVTELQSEAPKQVPTPKVDKPAAPASDGVQVGMVQAKRK
jgi:hypothetical protein